MVRWMESDLGSDGLENDFEGLVPEWKLAGGISVDDA